MIYAKTNEEGIPLRMTDGENDYMGLENINGKFHSIFRKSMTDQEPPVNREELYDIFVENRRFVNENIWENYIYGVWENDIMKIIESLNLNKDPGRANLTAATARRCKNPSHL